MRSTKDISGPNDDSIEPIAECIIPNEKLVHDNLTKIKCSDPSHGDGNMREGERVYAILAEEDGKLVPRSIACRECSAQSIYECSDKDTHLYIVEGVLEPTVCHNPNGMKITRVNILDEYVPLN